MRLLRLLTRWILLVATFGGVAGFAHEPGLSTATLRREGGALRLETDFAFADAQLLVAPADRPHARLEERDFPAWRPLFAANASGLWRITDASRGLLSPTKSRVELRSRDNVGLVLHFPFPAEGARLTFAAQRLTSLPPDHRQLVTILDEQGRVRRNEILGADKSAFTVDFSPAGMSADTSEPPSRTHFGGFLRLGLEHIVTGYDHLLFLFALLLVTQTLRSALLIITSFTVAHSLTLVAATLDWIKLPGSVAEPAIAATILFVGLENLWSRGQEPRARWLVTFAFGLVHGFGFANLLREVGVGTAGQGIGVPLFAFNLGVELGQIALAALALPLLWRLRQNPAFSRRVVPALSTLIALAGLGWLLHRLLAAPATL